MHVYEIELFGVICVMELDLGENWVDGSEVRIGSGKWEVGRWLLKHILYFLVVEYEKCVGMFICTGWSLS